MTSHSMKKLAFHSLLRWKMIILSILTTLLIHFSLRGWENVLLNLGVKGIRQLCIMLHAPSAVTPIAVDSCSLVECSSFLLLFLQHFILNNFQLITQSCGVNFSDCLIRIRKPLPPCDLCMVDFYVCDSKKNYPVFQMESPSRNQKLPNLSLSFPPNR